MIRINFSGKEEDIMQFDNSFVVEFNRTVNRNTLSHLQAGYVINPPEVGITIRTVNKELQKLLENCAITGSIINIIEWFVSSPYSECKNTAYKSVVTKQKENDFFTLKALRVDIENYPNELETTRRCIRCDGMVYSHYLRDHMRNYAGISREVFKKIWENDIFEFVCCKCYEDLKYEKTNSSNLQ